MPDGSFPGRIETVRDRPGEDRAQELLAFLSERAGMDPVEARSHLDSGFTVALDQSGEIAGLGSVFSAQVPMVGSVRLWLHRSVLLPEATGAEDDMLALAFGSLEEEFDAEAEGPIGICQLIRDPEQMRRTPEAVAPRTGLLHAGFLEDGAQLRIRYFGQASIGPRDTPLAPEAERAQAPRLDDRYRIEPLADSAATPDEVLAMWAREGAMPATEAARRVHEVDLVALDAEDHIVGVCSSYLQRNAQLRMDLHYFRAFVAEAHRRSSLAFLLALRAREHLAAPYATGADTRAAGILYEVESELLKRYRNEARWAATDFTYIGESPTGAHVRVHYFPGARVPPPD